MYHRDEDGEPVSLYFLHMVGRQITSRAGWIPSFPFSLLFFNVPLWSWANAHLQGPHGWWATNGQAFSSVPPQYLIKLLTVRHKKKRLDWEMPLVSSGIPRKTFVRTRVGEPHCTGLKPLCTSLYPWSYQSGTRRSALGGKRLSSWEVLCTTFFNTCWFLISFIVSTAVGVLNILVLWLVFLGRRRKSGEA